MAYAPVKVEIAAGGALGGRSNGQQVIGYTRRFGNVALGFVLGMLAMPLDNGPGRTVGIAGEVVGENDVPDG
jgi:hypothetical protein